MRKSYLKYLPLLIGELLLVLLAASCKKDKSNPEPDPVNFATLGLYEQIGGTNRRIFMAVSKIGAQTINYGTVFDTGSTGFVMDAHGVLPDANITSSGFSIPGDSLVVNGITVTTQQAIITYGGGDGQIQVYGNLAYAPITIGDGNGSVTTPRIPFFLYYKVLNIATNTTLSAHSADVFGVGPGVSATSRLMGSPLSYFKLPSNVTNGFRLATLNSAMFNTTATYVPSLLYIGLTPNDLAANFVMHPLAYSAITGYSPNIPSTITYNGQTINGSLLFDTGNPATTIIENSTAPNTITSLPANTTVSITTSQGFTYQYTTAASNNLTQVQNPSSSHDTRTIFSINFFISNEYLLDYTNHRIGLKNN